MTSSQTPSVVDSTASQSRSPPARRAVHSTVTLAGGGKKSGLFGPANDLHPLDLQAKLPGLFVT